MKNKLSPLAYQVSLRLEGFRDKKILIAFSGGRDSSVLLQILNEMRTRLNLQLAVAHIHHGDDQCSNSQKTYRENAASFSEQIAKKHALAFFLKKPDKSLKAGLRQDKNLWGETGNLQSESALRKVRVSLLESIRQEHDFDFIAYAHHAQDLFETRLIRFIRGTGGMGLESMRLSAGRKLRPLLLHWPDEINSYAKKNGLFYVDDPSNKDVGYLRNWIRNEWLAQLESKRPGAMRSFARSLELLAQESNSFHASGEGEATSALRMTSIDRKKFNSLSASARSTCIANYLRENLVQNYSHNMIQEICKRLDTPRKQLSFTVAGCEWTANAKQISAKML